MFDFVSQVWVSNVEVKLLPWRVSVPTKANQRLARNQLEDVGGLGVLDGLVGFWILLTETARHFSLALIINAVVKV